jgi:hypothetical protein
VFASDYTPLSKMAGVAVSFAGGCRLFFADQKLTSFLGMLLYNRADFKESRMKDFPPFQVNQPFREFSSPLILVRSNFRSLQGFGSFSICGRYEQAE